MTHYLRFCIFLGFVQSLGVLLHSYLKYNTGSEHERQNKELKDFKDETRPNAVGETGVGILPDKIEPKNNVDDPLPDQDEHGREWVGYPLFYIIIYIFSIIVRVPYNAIWVCASKRFKTQMDASKKHIADLKANDPDIKEHADCWKDPKDAELMKEKALKASKSL